VAIDLRPRRKHGKRLNIGNPCLPPNGWRELSARDFAGTQKISAYPRTVRRALSILVCWWAEIERGEMRLVVAGLRAVNGKLLVAENGSGKIAVITDTGIEGAVC
jgi:hypothetical protein